MLQSPILRVPPRLRAPPLTLRTTATPWLCASSEGSRQLDTQLKANFLGELFPPKPAFYSEENARY